jgi:hypothetical protein
MNDKIKNVLAEILEAFKSGLIPATIALSVFPPKNIPAAKWSLLNRTIMFLAGTADARGFHQWKQVNRSVKKGAHALYIFAPRFVKKKEEDKEQILTGWLTVPVFRFEDTEGESLDYENIPLPELPLKEVAESWGIAVKAIPGSYSTYGYYSPQRKEICLASEDESIFFHELSHAAHERVIGKLNPGQDPLQEIVAELSAQALCFIVGKTSKHLGNSYQYIESYAKRLDISPYTACVKVLGEVERVLEIILNPSLEAHPPVPGEAREEVARRV